MLRLRPFGVPLPSVRILLGCVKFCRKLASTGDIGRGVVGRGRDILNDASDDRVDVPVVSVRAELCAKCAYDCADPASDPPDTLDRGEDALSEIDGRDDNRSDVSVAAALMSMSTSAALSSES